MASNYHPPTETPLQELEGIEQLINQTLGHAAQTVLELSREQARVKLSESHNTNCLRAMEKIDLCLGKQIHYLKEVSTGQAHQGSCYAHAKDSQMAFHRLENVRTRIKFMIKQSEQRSLNTATVTNDSGLTDKQDIEALIM